jgi:hypothetical protein
LTFPLLIPLFRCCAFMLFKPIINKRGKIRIVKRL